MLMEDINMSLSALLLAVFLILTALSLFGWVAIAAWVLGIFALAAGIALLIEGFGHTVTVYKR